ncbi:MAG: sugar phosphate isomerase/epimerase [Desulfobulbaceae bacterium]|nr:sugar phosphate isomerase/epimerase [Desulfobulbaceae bacterium]
MGKIGDLGYQGVEILADVPHLYADSVGEEEVRELKEAVSRSHLKVANINTNTAAGYYAGAFWEPLFEPSLANPDEMARKWRIDYTKKAIDFAVFLESPGISITSGRPVPGCDPEYGLGLLQDSLVQLLDYAGQRGVRIGIEYEPGLLIESCRELAEFLQVLDSPMLGANLDLGHSYLLGEDVADVLRQLDGKVFHIHLEDMKGKKHFHLIPGLGSMNFEHLLTTLKEKYDGFVTVELYTYPQSPEEAARRAMSYLLQFPVWS